MEELPYLPVLADGYHRPALHPPLLPACEPGGQDAAPSAHGTRVSRDPFFRESRSYTVIGHAIEHEKGVLLSVGALASVALIPLPAGIIISWYIEEMRRQD